MYIHTSYTEDEHPSTVYAILQFFILTINKRIDQRQIQNIFYYPVTFVKP